MTRTGAQAGDASRRDLRRAQAGDARALNDLFRRELPVLRRWAHGRVPRPLWPRADVDDMVQLTFLRALRRYCEFKNREGSDFQHYLRRILINLTRDELRTAKRAWDGVEPDAVAESVQPSSLDLLLGQDKVRDFRRAVATLPPRSRAALLARLEHGRSYSEIATDLAAPGPGAARAIVGRAVERVMKEMRARAARSPVRRKKVR
jgi:RNA polymerase sigma-70 factor (ECF subfamily)